MITENERRRLKALEAHAHAITEHFSETLDFDPDTAEQARATGLQLALFDALFAIREGTAWRGITDPREMARQLLDEMGMDNPIDD